MTPPNHEEGAPCSIKQSKTSPWFGTKRTRRSRSTKNSPRQKKNGCAKIQESASSDGWMQLKVKCPSASLFRDAASSVLSGRVYALLQNKTPAANELLNQVTGNGKQEETKSVESCIKMQARTTPKTTHSGCVGRLKPLYIQLCCPRLAFTRRMPVPRG